MLWGKKEDDAGLPDLPMRRSSIPMMRERFDSMDHEDMSAVQNLPSFPDSPMARGFSQSAIKDAVETGDLPELPDFDGGDSFGSTDTHEMEEWKPRVMPPSTMRAMPKAEQVESPRVNKRGSVFVKLDKFENARSSLEVIKEKLTEVDELLKTIREVKRKEDEEISLWEREMDSIKVRINNITSDIFENPQF